jgi:hypothetical protein
MFAHLQSAIAAALLAPDVPTPTGIIGEPAPAPQRRFAVYRNNVVHSLMGAIRTRFPVTERIVGEEFFAAMAHAYVSAHPPRSKLMMHYGDDFPDFIAAFAPAAVLTYLPDIARLEAARTRAYHAADAVSLPPQSLAGLPSEALPSLRLALHPSIHIVRSRHPIVTIWAMNVGERPLASIENAAAEDALVVRPSLTVDVRLLPAGGAAFIVALAGGATLRAAVDAAFEDNSEFDLPGNLAGLITSGALTGIVAIDQ